MFETNVVHIQTKNFMICGEPRQIKNGNITRRIYFTCMIQLIYNFTAYLRQRWLRFIITEKVFVYSITILIFFGYA